MDRKQKPSSPYYRCALFVIDMNHISERSTSQHADAQILDWHFAQHEIESSFIHLSPPPNSGKGRCSTSTFRCCVSARCTAPCGVASDRAASCEKHNKTQHNTTQHNKTQHNTTQHNTTQHNTAQRNTTQHNTITVSKQNRRANKRNQSNVKDVAPRVVAAVKPSSSQGSHVLISFKPHFNHFEAPKRTKSRAQTQAQAHVEAGMCVCVCVCESERLLGGGLLVEEYLVAIFRRNPESSPNG